MKKLSLAGLATLTVLWTGQASAIPVVTIQPVSICLDNGTGCSAIAFNATALKTFWQNEAGITLNILPSVTFNSTAFQTMDTIAEAQNFVVSNPHPDAPSNFLTSPIRVWFSNAGYVPGPVHAALVGLNRSWVVANVSSNLVTVALAQALGFNLSIPSINMPGNLMHLVHASDVTLGAVFLLDERAAIAQRSRFVEEIDNTAVPVPAALPLFATGLGALGFIVYRRRRVS